MKFYLAGHTNFGNRGCEALARTIIQTVAEQVPEASFLVPATRPDLDAAQWPAMSECAAGFVPAHTAPPVIKWWNRLITRVPWTRSWWEPGFDLFGPVAQDVARGDAVLMIGGDVISLDYGPGSLFSWSGLMDAAARLGKPTMLYAASVTPLKDPVFEKYIVRHLQRYTLITVRETESLAYLHGLGIDKAQLVTDPAFRLLPQAVDLPQPFADAREGVLGFNLSPIIEQAWQRAGNAGDLVAEVAAFLDRVLKETGHNIVLVPHVDPLDGDMLNSDTAFLQRLRAAVQGDSTRLAVLPRGLNAAQLKHIIGACRFFMGGRTHATIAAWSQGVPTISFAYSTKAFGLNKDLFGSLDQVLKTPDISHHALWQGLQRLQEREQVLRDLLAERLPDWRRRASLSAELLAQHMNQSPGRAT